MRRFKKLYSILPLALAGCLFLVGCESISEEQEHIHTREVIAAVDATCIQAGHTAGERCATCGYQFVSSERIAPLGHAYTGNWIVDREPTEQREGERSMLCERCGERGSVEAIPCLAAPTVGLAFELNEEGTGYICTGRGTAKSLRDLRIPATYEGLPVLMIAEQAFAGEVSIESVAIPSTVLEIRGEAFADCPSLSAIELPDTVRYIAQDVFLGTAFYNRESSWENNALYLGRHLIAVRTATFGTFSVRAGTITVAGAAFRNCEKIEQIHLPDGILTVANSAFYGCSCLTNLTLPDSLEVIGNGAMFSCNALTDLALPAGVREIRSNPILCCQNLQTLTVSPDNPYFYTVNNNLIERSTGTLIATLPGAELPDDGSIKIIGIAAFYQFEDLTELTLPEGVEHIDTSAFHECINLERITFPQSLVSIGEQAFRSCTSLREITLHENFRHLGSAAFCYNYALESVTFAPGVTELEDLVFAYCDNLQIVRLPDTLKSMDKDPFLGCGKLKYETYENGRYIGNWLFAVINPSALSFTIKPGTTGLAPGALAGCYELTSLDLPLTLVCIGEGAFARCWGLTEVRYAGSERMWENIIKPDGESAGLQNGVLRFAMP